MSKYPECDKLSGVYGESQIIGAFLEWLQDEREPHVKLAYWDDRARLHLSDRTTEELLVEYFKIDMAKVEEERRAMIEACRRGEVDVYPREDVE